MLQAFLSLIGLGPSILSTIDGISNAIANEKIAALNATTEQEKIASQERTVALQAKLSVLLSDNQKSNLDIYVRTLIAVGPTSYILKYYLWDKVLQDWTNGSTDPLNSEMSQVLIATLGFYLLHSVVSAFRR